MAIPLFGFTPQQTRIEVPQRRPDSAFGSVFERAFLDSMRQESARDLQRKSQKFEAGQQDERIVASERIEDTRAFNTRREIKLRDRLQDENEVVLGNRVPLTDERVSYLVSNVPDLDEEQIMSQVIEVNGERFIPANINRAWLNLIETERQGQIETQGLDEGTAASLRSIGIGTEGLVGEMTREERTNMLANVDRALTAANIGSRYAAIDASKEDVNTVYWQKWAELSQLTPYYKTASGALVPIPAEGATNAVNIFARMASGQEIDAGQQTLAGTISWQKPLDMQTYGENFMKTISDASNIKYYADAALSYFQNVPNSTFYKVGGDKWRSNDAIDDVELATLMQEDFLLNGAIQIHRSFGTPEFYAQHINELGGYTMAARLIPGFDGMIRTLATIDPKWAELPGLLEANRTQGAPRSNIPSPLATPLGDEAEPARVESGGLLPAGGGIPETTLGSDRFTVPHSKAISGLADAWGTALGLGIPKEEIQQFVDVLIAEDDEQSRNLIAKEYDDILNLAAQSGLAGDPTAQEGLEILRHWAYIIQEEGFTPVAKKLIATAWNQALLKQDAR